MSTEDDAGRGVYKIIRIPKNRRNCEHCVGMTENKDEAHELKLKFKNDNWDTNIEYIALEDYEIFVSKEMNTTARDTIYKVDPKLQDAYKILANIDIDIRDTRKAVTASGMKTNMLFRLHLDIRTSKKKYYYKEIDDIDHTLDTHVSDLLENLDGYKQILQDTYDKIEKIIGEVQDNFTVKVSDKNDKENSKEET